MGVMASFPQGARFAVSKETIQRRPKEDYEQLLTSLSDNEDPYAGYFMEWLWSELFLGHQEPCPLPPMLAAVSHTEAMNSLIQRFPHSVQRQLSTARNLQGTGISGAVSGSNCICVDNAGGISSGISSGISGDVSGGVSGGISSGISGGISGGVSGGISGGVATVLSTTMKTTTTTTSTLPSRSTTSPRTASTSTSTTVAPSRTPYVIVSTESTTTTTTYNVTNMTNVTVVAGVLEVELYQQGNISQDALQDMFRGALAAAVEIPSEFVVKLNVSDLGEVSEIEET